MERPVVDPTQPLEALRPEVRVRYAARRAVAATLHRLPERMLVDRAKAEAPALRRSSERHATAATAPASN